jgi:hypothetical protein
MVTWAPATEPVMMDPEEAARPLRSFGPPPAPTQGKDGPWLTYVYGDLMVIKWWFNGILWDLMGYTLWS